MDDLDDDIPTLIDHTTYAIETHHSETSEKVPLTIISGFLGAGKSTLLKRILTEHHGFRIAVIMNEFGDTADIEAKTINVSSEEGAESEEFLELANGCLCCSIKDTGIAAIEKLMQRKGGFDHILLETTGLADPGPIASLFWHNEEFATGLGKSIALDGVICVVDAVFGKQQMAEDHSSETVGESVRQIACADVLILNKIDLATVELVKETTALMRAVNPVAPIYLTEKAQIDVGKILGLNAYASAPAFASTQYDSKHDHGHDPGHDHEHDHKDQLNRTATHYELRGISSLLVPIPVLTTARLAALDKWIQSVLWDQHLPETGSDSNELLVLRCKGLFLVESGAHFVLQGVRNMYDLTESSSRDAVGLPDQGKLVLIGSGLTDAVRASLELVVGT